MTDRRLARLLRGIVAAGVTATAVGSAVLVANGPLTDDLATFLLTLVVLAVAFGVVAWIAAGGQPSNRVVWVLASFVASVGVYAAGRAAIAAIAPEVSLPMDVETQVPADLPTAVAWIEGWTTAVVTFGFYNLLTFGLLLFPDGRLPSPRWRPAAAAVAGGILASSVALVVWWHPAATVAPFGPDGPGHALAWQVVNLFIFWGPAISLGGMVVRYRRSDSPTRSRFRWIIWGAAVLLPTAIIGSITATPLLSLAGGLIFVAAYGIAIIRYRLFDVDIVISRTFVYGALAVFIAAVYVAIVAGVGTLVGSTDEPSTGLAIAATVVVAVAFQPLRRHLERLANRLVYGRKATPYEVLSEFSHRVAATSNSLLEDVARSLAEGTRADRVVVAVLVDGETIEAASWPDPTAEQPTVEEPTVEEPTVEEPTVEEPTVEEPTEVTRFPVEDGGLTLGSLDLHLPTGQRLREDDRRLAKQLASGMGLALRNQLLTERLAVRVQELRESRRRLVAVQDETRRKLERDLHDGAQQGLVALRIKLGLSKTMAERDGAVETAAKLEELNVAADEAVDLMRDFARGVYPPLLEAEGLTAAISAQARRVPMAVIIDADSLGRYERTVEATVYFCVLEALRNTVQHSGASQATVMLAQHNGSVVFEVSDDGVGYDPSGPAGGVGITTMADRVDAIAGTLDVVSQPGEGTTIAGAIPALEVPR